MALGSLLDNHYYTLSLPRGKVRPADKLQLKAAIILPLVGLARSNQDPINRGHGAQYLYRPPPTLYCKAAVQAVNRAQSAPIYIADPTH